ncbi:MAG: TonB-dependent receptor [Acidobacteriaceae bacterium]|nr:TonB-dependent receptor [Acidobacteriaceae bacterium]
MPPLQTTVTVNATIRSPAPSSITVVTNEALQQIPGIEMDDRLRQVPGFSLFRRSSSVVANPTTQGVSLRATGSSGASRTLVLWDGLPLNDPFGGWVYWDRLDPGYISDVEIDRGATTSVFGDRALGGTISILSPPPANQNLYADFLTGNKVTEDLAAAYSNMWGLWGLSVHSRDLTTNGYYIVPASIRGTVDTRANLQFATGDVFVDYLGVPDRLSIHFDILAEYRNNGTQVTHNSTGLGTVGANYTHTWTNDQVTLAGFHTQEQFHSTFSSVAPNRDSEIETSRQTVPIQDTGGALYWQHHAQHWETLAGADADDTRGISYDYSYITHQATRSGGTLLSHGEFAQGNLVVGRAQFFAGIRQEYTGQHGETFVSPNGGVAVGLRDFRLRASAYRSYRAPTLNELYRNFRVGNVLTVANPYLVPEELVGVEAGMDWTRENTRVSLTLFHDDLNNLIDNATLATTPNQILRKRENFPSALSQGIEASVSQHWGHWMAQAGYMFADARLASGARIPLVPKQQGTAQLTYSRKNTMVSAGVRAFGLEFDDDLNQYLLPGYATVEFAVQQRITNRLSALGSIDNLLNRTYLVALTPNPNIGAPLLWRVGIRWSGAVR